MAERPEDLNLPTSVVARIIKDALPTQVKVSKEANAAIAKAASVFVLYATSCANNVALKSNRKTLHGNDVVHAMKDMEFEKFVKPLEQAWDSWKSCQAKKKEETAKRKKDKAEAEAKKQADSKSDSTKSDGASSPKKAKPATEDKENKEDDEVEEVPQE